MVGGSMFRVYQLWLFNLLEFFGLNDKKFRLVAEGPNKGLADLKELIEAGKLFPVLDKTFRLEEVPDALRYFGTGQHKGKITITIAGE